MNVSKRKKLISTSSIINPPANKTTLELIKIKGIAKQKPKRAPIMKDLEPIASTSTLPYTNPFFTQLPTPPISISNSPSPIPSTTTATATTTRKVKSKHTPDAIAAKLLREKASAKGKEKDLITCQNLYDSNKIKGGVSFLALDVETWERQHGVLLEFGYSFIQYEKMKDGTVECNRESQHIIIKENVRRHNGKFSPNETDSFDFGLSMTLSQVATHNLLSALFSTLSQQGPLILLFHDHRSDIKSLSQLGLPTSTYIHSLSPSPLLPHQVRILDTQSLYSGWKKEKGQVNLAKCLETVGVELDSDGIRVDQGSGRGRKWRAHNAGNDAVATLGLFEGMMERGRNHD